MNNKVKKDLIILVVVVVGCALCARYFAKGETLEEYAQSKNNDSSVSSEVSSVDSTSGIDNANEDISKSESVTDNVQINDTSDTKHADAEAASNSSTNKNDEPDDESIDDSMLTSDISHQFYYEPLSEEVISRITGISYVENDNISLDDLRYLSLLYVDFNGETKKGEMICNKEIAQDLLEIFYELYNNGYQIESIKLIDEFDGDDTQSMLANNTSCFNYRVVDDTTRLSNHAYGLAVDINPFYNPYITFKNGVTKISPEGSEAYADRTQDFPYKIDENDLAYKLFTQHGFKWGGNWNSVKDYQHFERPN